MASKSSDVTSMNSAPSTLRLARTFLRSLARIKSQNPRLIATATATATIIAPSTSEIKCRSRRIKVAAYSSMARMAGPRRAWARALLFKLQTTRPAARQYSWNNNNNNNLMIMRRRRRRRRCRSELDQVGKLRRLVPGGDGMDVCTLLEETAHFIHCLSTQVNLMKAISQHLH